MELCRWMRWKGYHARDWSSPEELETMLTSNEHFLSCLRTTQPFGPDGQPAVPELCGGHRACFERSAMNSPLRQS